jgi:[ribosomal protein S5]-alanine N-acetyltransferase
MRHASYVLITDDLIQTERLDLVLIGAGDLITLFRDCDNPSLWQDKPYTNPHRVLMDDPGPLHWRVPQVESDPSLNRWFVRFIVLKSSRVVVGAISFHGAPDERGMIEIGMGIDPDFRGRGFAKEALHGMWQWACAQPDVAVLRYTVSPENEPSVAIVESFGFPRIGQQMDEIDGPEDIYEMTVSDYLIRHGDAHR